ncbi:hypothetical protein [uncultured Amnibacterium sp.]|uniref:glycosyltransferase family protein n=1 Tax=uncultured Amnibacterium sp. TaxID=1631851 RepID=UPI0035CC7875
MTVPRRVFYVPNEIGDALQFGYRRAFADLLAAGLLDEVEVFSLERRIHEGGERAAHRADLLQAVRRFQPDLLFMQHLGATGLTAREIGQLRAAAPALLYQEADPYSRWLHPLPAASGLAARAADVVFTVGAGTFSANLRRAGARRVEWTPSVFDPARIDRSPGGADRPTDVVVVANRNRARVRPLPSAADRVRFVRLLQSRHGERLALYGNGWDGPGTRGPVAYSDQTDALRSAWISANWDHFATEPCYFSDRLAISLASGSIHATTLHPGQATVFPGDETDSFLITGSTPQDLAERIEHHLSRTSVDERLAAEQAASRFAWSHLRQDDHLITMLNAAGVRLDPPSTRAVWDLGRAPLAGG